MSPVCLTFDDGPDPHWTPQVLEALERTNVTATFFVVAEQVATPSGPALLQAIRDAGHVVQAHCSRHNAHDELDLAALRADATNVLEVLEENSVSRPSLWRPPYGRLNRPDSFKVADEVGLQLVLWTLDTGDYAGWPWEKMLAEIAPALYDDSVILMHDSRRYAETEGAANTISLIEPLVGAIRERGIGIGTLSAPLSWRERRPGELIDLVPSG